MSAANETVQVSRSSPAFLAAHDQTHNLGHLHRDYVTAVEHRAVRMDAFQARAEIAGAAAAS
jgi:hypothetical protein